MIAGYTYFGISPSLLEMCAPTSYQNLVLKGVSLMHKSGLRSLTTPRECRDRGIILENIAARGPNVPGLACAFDAAHPHPEEGRERLSHIEGAAIYDVDRNWGFLTPPSMLIVQGDRSGCAKPPVDIFVKVAFLYKDHILNHNFQINANGRFCTT